MSNDQIALFVGLLQVSGVKVKPYSGRAMEGKVCVSVSQITLWRLAKVIGSWTGIDQRLIDEPRTDQLGTGEVYYWPSFSWPTYIAQ